MLKTEKSDFGSSDFGPEDYVAEEIDGVKYLYFQCPGCGQVIGAKHIIKPLIPGEHGWRVVDFETLTVRESIKHTKPDGCGWHGYLTNGELKGQIE